MIGHWLWPPVAPESWQFPPVQLGRLCEGLCFLSAKQNIKISLNKYFTHIAYYNTSTQFDMIIMAYILKRFVFEFFVNHVYPSIFCLHNNNAHIKMSFIQAYVIPIVPSFHDPERKLSHLTHNKLHKRHSTQEPAKSTVQLHRRQTFWSAFVYHRVDLLPETSLYCTQNPGTCYNWKHLLLTHVISVNCQLYLRK